MKALIIIDLQKRFSPNEKLINGILKEAKNYNMVVATKFINGNSLFQKAINFQKLSKIDLNLCELPNKTKIFEKMGYAVSDELIKYLKSKKITEVDICGLQTDACILASSYKFWDCGIKPNILYKLSETSSTELQKATKLITKRNFGF